jgi:uncharacterized protein YfaS (alpha-2-macroglobulin family)
MPESVQAYIYGYTSGTISRTDPVRIRFASAVATAEQIGQAAQSSLLRFEPSIKGEAVWEDPQTLRFEPASHLQSGTVYVGTVDLSSLFDKLPDGAETFEFDFRTRDQFLQVDVEGLHAPNPSQLSQQEVKGVLLTADYAETEEVEAVLTAQQNGNNLPVRWSHSADGTLHDFYVEKVSRTEKAGQLALSWDGEPLNLSLSEKKTVEVPALGDFKVTDVRAIPGQEQSIKIHFSDPLLSGQDYTGLVRIENYNGSLRFLEDGNSLLLFPSERLVGKQRVTISQSVKNVNQNPLKDNTFWDINIKDIKPEVRLVGTGVVLPSTDGLLFPFEAVNLSAVEVEVFKIYHNNILQFLQNNRLDGSSSLYEVGRLVKQTRVALSNLKPGANTSEWTRYALQLDDLIASDPDAIYQIRIGFRPEYSLYACGENAIVNSSNTEEALTITQQEELNSFMDDWYGFGGRYPGFEWQHRDDPCYPAYYNPDRFIRRNVVASNIGLIAKSGQNGECLVVVSDLRTAQPISGAVIEFYDYQQQLLGTATTDGDGMAKASLEREPFVVLAKQGQERGYLRLQDGDALSMSRFDVSGQVVQQGLKGYFYGERGVWRPGDSVYLHFVLEDKEGQLPPNYPVRFELRDPRGQVKLQRTTAENNHFVYPLYFETRQDDPTGIWQASIKAGGVTFQKNLRIETVKPNRLKINLDFGKAQLSQADEPLTPSLRAEWLHGAPASKLKARVEAELQAVKTQFKGYDGFAFDDPARQLNPTTRTVYEGTLDNTGEAALSFQLSNKRYLPGQLKAVFKTRVFERGGDFSTSQMSLPYDPYTAYAGVKIPLNKYQSKRLELDKPSSIDLAAVSPKGNGIPNRKLSVGLYRVEWRWWWDRSNDEVSRYNSSTHYGALQQSVVTTDMQGRADWNLKIEEWGRYLVRVCDTETGHCSGDYFYAGYPWYGDDDGYRKEAAMLSFSSDKPAYQVGEKVTIQLPDGKAGRMLLSVETGREVIDNYWVETKEGENTFTFEATADMAPTAYVHLSMIQPHGQVENDLPIRMYGVIPIKVEDPDTRLQPVADAPKELRPKESFKVKVSEQNGKPMTYTLAVVDEGLLDLTNFKTPNLWDHFYAREALGVRTWDVYDEVLGAYGGQLQRLLSIGGDAAVVNRDKKEVNRFEPVVLHLGPYRLEKGKTATHELEMPNYVGSVRVMVVAADEGAYGKTDVSVPVRQPLMVLGTLPRVLGPGESLELPVNVFAMKSSVKDVNVSLKESSGLVQIGDSRRQVRFNSVGDQIVSFPVKVREQVGMASFTIVAEGNGERATQEIAIEVRNPNPYVSAVDDKVLQTGTQHTFEYTPIGMPGTNEITLEVSSIPPIDMGRRLKYLIRYPYGCLEQTLSGAFPQLYAGQVLELEEQQKKQLADNVRAGIDRLGRFQTAQGGLGYWPGQAPNQWSSNYAAHFLLEAQSLGYTVPSSLLNPLLQYQKKVARLWDPAQAEAGLYGYHAGTLDQAYRLYTLALAKQPDMAAMNRLKTYAKTSTTAKWRLAAAYALAGKPEVAAAMTDNLGVEVDDYRELSYTFGSSTRDQAMILEALVLMDQQEEAAKLVRTLSESLSNQRWMSTQETAYSLLAIAKYAKGDDVGQPLAFRYSINGKQASAGTDLAVMQIPLPSKTGSVQVENTGKGVLFTRLIRNGQPLAGEEQAAASSLGLTMRFLDKEGQALDPSNLPQGTDFVAEVTINHPGRRPEYYKELALSQVFPSGWEITNTRMDQLSAFNAGSSYDYQDIRDDRVHTFFGLPERDKHTYRVQLTAAYQGRFYLPATSCEAMYDRSIYAREPGQWVEVGPPQAL